MKICKMLVWCVDIRGCVGLLGWFVPLGEYVPPALMEDG